MAINDKNNAGRNADADTQAERDSSDGDILEQLKAESASTTNLYKLELKLFKTVTNMNKTMLAEQKLFKQSKKNLDSITANIKSIDKNVSLMSSTMTSVDSTLKQVLTALGQVQDNTSNIGSIAPSSSSSTSRSSGDDFRLDKGASTIQSHIDDFRRDLDILLDDFRAGEITLDEYWDSVQDAQQNIITWQNKFNEYNEILASATNDFSNYRTAQQRYHDEIEPLKEAFAAGNITVDAFRESLENAKETLDATEDALKESAVRWKASDNKPAFSSSVEEQIKAIKDEYEDQYKTLKDRFDRQVPDEQGRVMSEDDFAEAVQELADDREATLSGLNSQLAIYKRLDKFFNDFSSGSTYDARTGQNTTAGAAVETVGGIAGDILGKKTGEAIGAAIGGPVGAAVGSVIGDLIGSKITAFTTLISDRLNFLANQDKKSRDEVLKAGMEKIRSDVRDMATYSIEIYEKATSEIYSAWDKNLAQVSATQGYTKEALNSLQDAVAQRLQAEGYGNTIDASQFADELASTLRANLGGELAEAFAAQNLILQKAVPEVDLSASAAQFAAIYANANRQGGNGESAMIDAMNEIAGAAKALESVTEGNNQFLKQTSSLLTKATEVVEIAGGNATQISGLTTQMMASEAAITSVAPQLSGFTEELVSVLMNNNDATAVALRAVMNDINSDIGVSATSFMKSFMEDTQGTLSTAFAAIQRFINNNENPESRQEFLNALESVFGVSGSKLAQIDFGSVANLIAEVNTQTNMNALTKAENLVRSGETTTLEEQLVANTANQLLATNAIGSTLDNKLMRKLETNELTMEKVVYQLQATQSVDLAENSLTFFTRISDLIMSIIDPLGLFDMVSTAINASTSESIDAERYLITSTLAGIGSTVTDSSEAMSNAYAKSVGGALAVMDAAQTKSTDAMVAAVERNGVTQTFEGMVASYYASTKEAQAQVAANTAESNAVSYTALEQQARQSAEYQQQQKEAQAKDDEYEKEKAAAREQQKALQQEEELRAIENHENINIIKDTIENINIDEYLMPILEEHRTHTEQINRLDERVTELVKLFSTVLEYKMSSEPEFESTIAYDDRARIMDNGYVTNSSMSFR